MVSVETLNVARRPFTLVPTMLGTVQRYTHGIDLCQQADIAQGLIVSSDVSVSRLLNIANAGQMNVAHVLPNEPELEMSPASKRPVPVRIQYCNNKRVQT